MRRFFHFPTRIFAKNVCRKGRHIVKYNQRWEKVGNYFGTYNRVLDDKHRLQLPSKLVGELPARFYAIKGHEGAITVFEENGFKAFLEDLKKRSYLDREVRAYTRAVTASTNILDVDSHGRISLPSLEGEVVVIGVIDHFEIFSKENHEALMKDADLRFDELAQIISDHEGK